VLFSALRMSFRPNGMYLLLGGFGFYALLVFFSVTLVFGFTRRKNFIYRWMILPLYCLICIVSLRFMNPLGLMLRDIEFKDRIKDYDSVVNDIRDGKVPCIPDANHDFAVIDMAIIKNLPPTVIGVTACRCNDGRVVILFQTTRIQGLAFADSVGEGLCSGAKDQLKGISLSPIAKNWYRYSEE